MPNERESGGVPLPPPLGSPRNLVVVGLAAATFVLLIVLVVSSLSTLTSLRGHVLGNGQWSKAQKKSVNALHRFARMGLEVDWADYEMQVAVIQGDRMAREELERPVPDMAVVMRGFEQGQIPEEYHQGMAVLYRRARRLDFVAEAIAIWEEADRRVDEMRGLAQELRVARNASEIDAARIEALLGEIDGVDDELTSLENAFTATLNRAAFGVERLLRWVLLGIAGISFLGLGASLRYLYKQVLHREEILERSEARYRALFEQSLVGTLVVSEEGTVNRANAAFASMFGYDSPDELLGRPTTDFYVDPAEQTKLVAELRARGVVFVDELLVRRKDGSGVWMMTRSVLVEMEDGRWEILVTGIDITARKDMEQRLARRGRMEAMGQMAGGIAHDFNNLLTAILGNAALLERELSVSGPGDGRQILSEILSSSRTAAAMTEQLLAFSRGDPTAASFIDLADLLRGMRTLLDRLLPESILLETEAPDDPAVVRAPPAQLRQILLNLVVNARDAMPHGGHIMISVDRVDVDGSDVGGFVDLEAGPYVRLSVADDGPGIEPELRGRLFEPFFTMKPGGVGTGMGLATVYGVATRAGGTVYVDPDAEPGATFRVLLPQYDEPPLAPPMPEQALSTAGSETIFLVEDDDAVRRVARRILEHAGYRVLEASNGIEASGMVEAGESFDLLVTDVVMPGMGGVELAAHIIEDRPDVPILFVSGYSNVALQSDALQSAMTDSLAKPFTPAVLTEHVRALLESAARRAEG